MVKILKKANFWVRRRSHMVLLLVGAVVILLLFFNDETSIARNIEYRNEITRLKREIQLNIDSAAYYREKTKSVLAGRDELERLAREKFHMQRPTEDVFLVDEK